MDTDTLIIGGGLSGLYTAYLLHTKGRPFQLLEARPKFGGRIRTVRSQGTALELGASWFWPETNPRVARLVEQFGLDSFPQHTAGNVLVERSGRPLEQQPHEEVDPRLSLRLSGGTSGLFAALLEAIPSEQLHLGQEVSSISQSASGQITVLASADQQEQSFTASNVIVAMPLRLAGANLSFAPALPSPVLESFLETPTWMAGEAKFLASYAEPFWRDSGFSGSAFSEIGPLSECHDASSPGGVGALLGFLLPDIQERKDRGDELVAACLEQLARHFGPAAASPTETILMDWATEPLTATKQDVPLMGHPIYNLPAGSLKQWDGRLRFAGTESVTENAGYLEGALEAAELATDDL